MKNPEIRDRILHAYMDYQKEHGHAPESVFKFCKELGLEERQFFAEFSSFDPIESLYWQKMLVHVVQSVTQGEEWSGFGAKQRMLAFLFAFFEEALAHRSLMLIRFKPLGPLAKPDALKGFESSFSEFAKEIIEHGVVTGEIADRGRINSICPHALYLLLRTCILFHLKDDSESYERTDAYVEKSVNLTFELLRNQAFDSALDLARFLIPGASKSCKS